MINYEIKRPDLQKQNRKFVRKKILSKAALSFGWLVVPPSKSKNTNFKVYCRLLQKEWTNQKKQKSRYTTFNLTLEKSHEIFFPGL